jgi:hypothetical protein
VSENSSQTVSKMEQRMWSAIVGVALLLGGWWLQNQYDTTLRIHEELMAYMRHVDDKYVQKDYLETLEGRLNRIESKIDNIAVEHKNLKAGPNR